MRAAVGFFALATLVAVNDATSETQWICVSDANTGFHKLKEWEQKNFPRAEKFIVREIAENKYEVKGLGGKMRVACESRLPEFVVCVESRNHRVSVFVFNWVMGKFTFSDTGDYVREDFSTSKDSAVIAIGVCEVMPYWRNARQE